MPELLPADVTAALAVGDDEAVLDRLNALVLRQRRDGSRLPRQTASALMQRMDAINAPLAKVAAWDLLAFAEASPDLYAFGVEWLQNPRNAARPQALGALLTVFPEKREALIALCGREADQFIRHEIATSFMADQPRRAWELLCALVESEPNLSGELEELIPGELALLSSDADLHYLDRQARLHPDTRIWADTERLIYGRRFNG